MFTNVVKTSKEAGGRGCDQPEVRKEMGCYGGFPASLLPYSDPSP